MSASARIKGSAAVARYLPWIFRDYITNQGPSTALVVLLVGFLSFLPVVQGSSTHLNAIPREVAVRLLRAMVPPLVLLGTFFATNGIIANDRKLGFYRFLFAKPISPPVYYSATFAVYGFGLLIVLVALLAVWAVVVRPMFPLELVGVVLAMYVAYGGIGFLLSALFRFDWLSLVTVLVAANVLWSVWGNVEGMRHWILYVLPPVHRANDIYSLVMRDAPQELPWASGLWIVGYGLGCFVLGIFVLRKRPLGSA